MGSTDSSGAKPFRPLLGQAPNGPSFGHAHESWAEEGKGSTSAQTERGWDLAAPIRAAPRLPGTSWPRQGEGLRVTGSSFASSCMLLPCTNVDDQRPEEGRTQGISMGRGTGVVSFAFAKGAPSRLSRSTWCW